MKYTKEQEETIKKGKIYLKAVRTIKRERFQLLEEYNDNPTPSSITFQETKGVGLSQVTIMNDYTIKRELLLKKAKLLNQVLDEFLLKTILLSTRQRQIIDTYMNAKSYSEMIDELNDHYYISLSTYKRELPEICISLSKYIDFNDIPLLENINDRLYKSY